MKFDPESVIALVRAALDAFKRIHLSRVARNVRSIEKIRVELEAQYEALVRAGYRPKVARELLKYSETIQTLADALRAQPVLQPQGWWWRH